MVVEDFGESVEVLHHSTDLRGISDFMGMSYEQFSVCLCKCGFYLCQGQYLDSFIRMGQAPL